MRLFGETMLVEVILETILAAIVAIVHRTWLLICLLSEATKRRLADLNYLAA